MLQIHVSVSSLMASLMHTVAHKIHRKELMDMLVMTGVGAHLELFDSAPYTISVRRVEDKDECICVVEIVLP